MTKKNRAYIVAMKEYRARTGMSQEDMAQKLGIRQQVYSNVETGRTDLSPDFITDYEKITGINLLYVGSEKPKTTPPPVIHDNGECQTLKERLAMKDEMIAMMKSQIALLERMLGK